LTQRFFETAVLSGRLLPRADPQKGRFRPYLKQAIRNFLVDERRRAGRSVGADVRPDVLEGGWDAIVPESSHASPASPGPDAELLRAWARSLVAMAVTRLEAACQARGQQQHFQLFVRRYMQEDDRRPSWRDVGSAFGLDEKIARSRAETAAGHFRALLRELVASDAGAGADIDQEIQAVIAVL
jgi:RNA polymerase sigma-70 factor (ECF subfamily)